MTIINSVLVQAHGHSHHEDWFSTFPTDAFHIYALVLVIAPNAVAMKKTFTCLDKINNVELVYYSSNVKFISPK